MGPSFRWDYSRWEGENLLEPGGSISLSRLRREGTSRKAGGEEPQAPA